jgi:hypothetical protein
MSDERRNLKFECEIRKEKKEDKRKKSKKELDNGDLNNMGKP